MSNHFEMDERGLLRRLILANQARLNNEFHKAIEIYLDEIEQFGETVEVNQVLANCYFELGLHERDEANFHEAITWIKRAIVIAPMNGHLFDNLGSFHSLGAINYQAAAQAFKTAIELDPNNVHALVNAAAIYGVPEEVVALEEAIFWLKRAVQLDPGNPNYHLNLGILFKEAEQWSDAKNELRNALLCPRALDAAFSKTLRKIIEEMKP